MNPRHTVSLEHYEGFRATSTVESSAGGIMSKALQAHVTLPQGVVCYSVRIGKQFQKFRDFADAVDAYNAEELPLPEDVVFR